MNPRPLWLRFAVAIGAFLAVLSLGLPSAGANIVPTPTPPVPTPQPTGGSQSGSSGGAQQGTASNCSLYATSSSFGLSCVHGSGKGTKVAAILHGDPASFCWDEPISDHDLALKYEYQPNPNAPYYLHSCISGLDPARSQYDQRGVVLSQQVIEIPGQATDCKRPYAASMLGTCIMRLTANQNVIVGLLKAQAGQIPGVIITTHPSTRVRTNEDVAYTDRAEGGLRRTARFQVGGVTMWAEMGKFVIYPYGPDGTVSKTCDGTADVSNQDTPASMPNACWWAYDKSSAAQPDQQYPFRAEADWTVYVSSPAGTRAFATFKKYTDLRLPVYDIQSIVVP